MSGSRSRAEQGYNSRAYGAVGGVFGGRETGVHPVGNIMSWSPPKSAALTRAEERNRRYSQLIRNRGVFRRENGKLAVKTANGRSLSTRANKVLTQLQRLAISNTPIDHVHVEQLHSQLDQLSWMNKHRAKLFYNPIDGRISVRLHTQPGGYRTPRPLTFRNLMRMHHILDDNLRAKHHNLSDTDRRALIKAKQRVHNLRMMNMPLNDSWFDKYQNMHNPSKNVQNVSALQKAIAKAKAIPLFFPPPERERAGNRRDASRRGAV